ncbi:MAG TPA: cyclic nucleotide-binding domain-containing protein, partial [Chloroflexota bacterium]|nr:cyclic nucleotide-binding domain-containing protein [Chloroflexota bacterium]
MSTNGPSTTAERSAQRRKNKESSAGRPVLNDFQLGILGRYGAAHVVAVGDLLFTAGDETYDLFVVLEGEVDIVEHFGRPKAAVLATYGSRQFLGEIGLLTGQRVYLTAAVSGAGRVLH